MLEIMYYRAYQHSHSMEFPQEAFYDALRLLRRMLAADDGIIHGQITTQNRDALLIEYNRRRDGRFEINMSGTAKAGFPYLTLRDIFVPIDPAAALDDTINAPNATIIGLRG